jgi:hypothetical protein
VTRFFLFISFDAQYIMMRRCALAFCFAILFLGYVAGAAQLKVQLQGKHPG